ncbi:DUF38 domain-containing protein [Caenorhabditis elegans]|uniref:DUF38 domain-containing protein n=1 Tax=Caenorhabditis elegans TaxID=6239 RepID=Q9U2D3_CAEEL|nr:DUF38 domain-containing protein [Caenorhabditis elegans]CAB55092.1 DUF38 domain-containing protein [Caenorhabditis elegans]|eukprot:NP_499435.1 F-box A protein [Caenorhabditis elegans]
MEPSTSVNQSGNQESGTQYPSTTPKLLRYFICMNSVDSKRIAIRILNDVPKLFIGASCSHRKGAGALVYKSVENGCIVEFGTEQRFVEGGNSFKLAFDDLEEVIRFFKYSLESLEVLLDEKVGMENRNLCISSILGGLSMHVSSLSLRGLSSKEMMLIISKCESGVLESIHLGNCNMLCSLNEICQLEQWKMTKSLNAHGGKFSVDSIQHLFHFTEFTITLDTLSTEDAINVRDVLVKSSNFLHCYIHLPFLNIQEIATIFKPDFSNHSAETFTMTLKETVNEFIIDMSPYHFKITNILHSF